jgi:hypothetical protein
MYAKRLPLPSVPLPGCAISCPSTHTHTHTHTRTHTNTQGSHEELMAKLNGGYQGLVAAQMGAQAS